MRKQEIVHMPQYRGFGEYEEGPSVGLEPLQQAIAAAIQQALLAHPTGRVGFNINPIVVNINIQQVSGGGATAVVHQGAPR